MSIYYNRLLNSFQAWSDKSWGWNTLFVRGHISCKIIKTDCDAGLEGIFEEINLRKKKWLLCCSYNPRKVNIVDHLKNICKTLDKLSTTYDSLVLLGDFNAEHEEESIAEFLNLYNLKNLVKQNTCFKIQINPHVLISYWQIALVVCKIRIPSKQDCQIFTSQLLLFWSNIFQSKNLELFSIDNIKISVTIILDLKRRW